MEDETRNSSDLLRGMDVYSPELYVWRGQHLVGHQWEPLDAPEGGDSVSLDTFGMRHGRDVHDASVDGVRYVEIRGTAWGDYSGSTYDRSNARSIRRDYGEHVVTVTGWHGFEVLVVPLGVQIPVELYDAIVGLCEYPLYDESDLSSLESELEMEDWESWGRSDWAGEIRKRAQAVDRDDDVAELDVSEYVDALFWDIVSEGDVGYWQAETAVSGYWTDFERAADLAWAEIQKRRVTELDEWGRALSAPIPGQLALPV